MIAFDPRGLTLAGVGCFFVAGFVRIRGAHVEYIRILTNPATLSPRRAKYKTSFCADFVPLGARHRTPITRRVVDTNPNSRSLTEHI